MPSRGQCTDTACDHTIRELYECHCCSRFICLIHLIEHVEKTKQNQQQIIELRNELKAVIDMLESIIEEKSLVIKREQRIIEQAKNLLDMSTSSVSELKKYFIKISQIINLNRKNQS